MDLKVDDIKKTQCIETCHKVFVSSISI